MQATELVMEQKSRPISDAAPTPAGIRTILFHVHDDDALDKRLQVALSLARAFGAHLHLLHVTPVEAYMVTDAFGVFVSPQILQALEQEAAKLRARLQAQLAGEDVSWDYEDVTGELMAHIVQCASLADVVIAGRHPRQRDFNGPAVTFLGNVLETIRTPLLIIGDEADSIDPFGAAVVAWNGSYEAANALRAAVPMLKLASRVRLVKIEEQPQGRFPSTRALEYLSRHGVHAELCERIQFADEIGQEIVDQAVADRASYVVMGAFGHSRAGEFLFGGVTRSLLKACEVPLLMAR